MRRFALVALNVAAIAALVIVTRPQPLPTIDDTAWASYEYVGDGTDRFHQVPVINGTVSVDDSGWTIDWPEDPDSILALLTYRDWQGRSHLDLRGKRATVRMRGEQLALQGAHVTFWIVTDGERWHLDRWMTPTASAQTWVLELDGPWRESWSPRGDPGTPDDALRNVQSYGLAFVGFSSEVMGRLVVEVFRFD